MRLDTLNITRRLRSSGDAAVWVAPRPDHTTATVLVFTTREGRGYAVELTREELVTLRDTADMLLQAESADVDRWLDRAAKTVRAQRSLACAQRKSKT